MVNPGIYRQLEELGFGAPHLVRGRSSVADLFKLDERCGIYVLLFDASDTFYVGQAVDVARRYIDHRHNKDEIVGLSFKKAPKKQLNDVEREAIRTLERAGFKLQNKDLVSMPLGKSDFDQVVEEDEQTRWIDDVSFNDLSGDLPDLVDLAEKSRKAFARLEAHPLVEQATALLQMYIARALPMPVRTTPTFWGVTCLPQTRGKPLFRVNVFWQEVIAVFDEDGDVSMALQVARSRLADAYGAGFRALKRDLGAQVVDHVYERGGAYTLIATCEARGVNRFA